jgi:hypothetical protein
VTSIEARVVGTLALCVGVGLYVSTGTVVWLLFAALAVVLLCMEPVE